MTKRTSKIIDDDPLPSSPPVDVDPADECLVGKAIVCARTNLTFTSIWRLMQLKKFPRARTSGNKICWLKSEIDSWIKNRPVRRYRDDTDGEPPPSYHNVKARTRAKKAT